MADEDVSLLVIFPYSTKQKYISPNDRRLLLKLSHFLGATKKFHGATCLEELLTHRTERDSQRDYRPKNKEVKPVGNGVDLSQRSGAFTLEI